MDIVDGVEIYDKTFPNDISLFQNYPNPFNPVTEIQWNMPLHGEVSINIYNIRGQFMENLYDGMKQSGVHHINWNAESYPSGIYIYSLTMDDNVLQKKMILIK